MGNALQVVSATVMQKCVCVEVLLVLVRQREKRLGVVSGGQQPEVQEVQAAVEWVVRVQDLVALVAQ